MLTSSGKNKGRRLSTRVKEKLLLYRPDIPSGDIKVTCSGETGPDLQFSERASKEFPFVIEAKNQEKIAIWRALKQLEKHKKSDLQTRLLIFARNHSDDYVTLKLDDFLKLVM